MSVKRYNVMSYSLDVDGNSGPFVKYEDYAALEAKHAALASVPDAATAIRACMEEFPESVRDIVEECAVIAENVAQLRKGDKQ